MLNDEPRHLVFVKDYNTKFDEIFITFTDQNGIPLETGGKVNLTLFIKRKKKTQYSIAWRTRKYDKGYGFLSFYPTNIKINCQM